MFLLRNHERRTCAATDATTLLLLLLMNVVEILDGYGCGCGGGGGGGSGDIAYGDGGDANGCGVSMRIFLC